ncbi:hypothetical protein TWF225_003571 [Orbilia oligospora]|uniref:lytic cellulose monooxygenase (C4-dehydrogenating) n=1 Tax=Orbilia oligospora TaxID=2813651 RepID=A0A7C8PGA9_ORBOL|nr:hypothetical protein TWF751_009221 [Orbilia oligospora]KAF3195152.1 hypothetical protein TWF225_003571 [Orbilia oligospora]KAF3259506.1 hypothetical protein TWF217_005202 [Orbilia oligospora]KAF3263991.1 hypothetical protein TWF128_001622 [Orbilia oligospora]KAF3287812.1 hypothetical protein TWF132_008332 [Orbilia oligospora]
MKSTTLLSLLSLASTALCHAYIKELVIGGQVYAGFDPFYQSSPQGVVQPWDTNNRNTDGPMRLSDGDGIICGRNPSPAQNVAKAPAGSQITFRWSRWQSNHQGPIITYLADCGGDCRQARGANLQWFKIDEAGLLQQGYWATDHLIRQGYEWKIQLPQNIKSGQYLMRHEMIALQFATQQNGAQFFTSCTNLDIEGGTGQSVPQGVRLQDYYNGATQGLFVNIQGLGSYPIPGPQVAQGLGVTPSVQMNDGSNNNPSFPQTFPNEPTDDNGTVANVHLDYAGGSSGGTQQFQQQQGQQQGQYVYYPGYGYYYQYQKRDVHGDRHKNMKKRNSEILARRIRRQVVAEVTGKKI